MIERLSAADNLVIDCTPGHWRLLQHEAEAETVLIEARGQGLPMRYPETFGTARRLPKGGRLATEDIERVALGYSQRDHAWLFGLVLMPALAELRGSRWCGLAVWPAEGEAPTVPDGAEEAARALALQLGRPFTLIPPKIVAHSAPLPPAIPPAPLPELPYVLDDWRLTQEEAGVLAFSRSGAWARGRALRALWYLLWAVIFVVLSVTSLTSGIMLPQPAFLPYVGFACALLLVGMAVYTFRRAVRAVSRITVSEHEVTGWRGTRALWHVPAAEVQAVYASQIVSRVSPRRRRRAVLYGEIALLRRDGAFAPLVHGIETDEKLELPESADWDSLNVESVQPLFSQPPISRLQAAALRTAALLGTPAFDDRRIR